MKYSPWSHTYSTAATLDTSATPSASSQWATLDEVRIHITSVAATDDLVVALDSSLGVAYDVVLYTKTMTGLSDWWYGFDPAPKLRPGDILNFTFTNTNASTLGIEAIGRLM